MELEKDAHSRCTSLGRIRSFSAVQPARLTDSMADDQSAPGPLFSLPTFGILSLQPDPPVTGSYFLEPSLKYMLLFVCDWTPLSLSRSWT